MSETQSLTIACKLQVADALVPEINETMLVFAVACDWINANTPEKMTNKTAMQSLVYQDVRRNFGLSSNLAIQAIRRVCANRKTAFQKGKQVKKFSPTSVSYDARIFSFRETDWTVSIKLLNSRQRLKLLIGNYQVGLLKGQEPTSAVLVKRRNGEYYIHITIDQPTNPITETNNVLGVDLGRTDIATTSEGESWSGKQITDKRNHYAKLRASLQKKATKGTRSTRRRCRQLLAWLSGKEKRFQKHINHEISRLLVNHAVTNKKAIAIEDLTGIRERTNKKPRSKIDKRLGNSWAFYQLRQFLTYKCILAGVKLILVNPAWTSQTCHKCLAIGDRKGKKFSCSRCGNQCDADYNGAKNIEALGRIINTPGGSGLSCKLKTEVQYIQLSLFDDLGLLKTSTSA
ncbi:MAG: RNA-guided endonuclease InsQ/TnpB family protein [Planktothrix sp.]|uniref:RNA-guided endonuclease InsQ/TnpB family protein n=1 Tax=Planktothrix sp. TaxID=3088171 RepID=UPI0038D39D08